LKRDLVLLLGVFSLFAVCVPEILVVEAEQKTVIVPDDYATIQGAVDAASAGDTVFVRDGTYYERIEINKPLTLVGESKEKTVVDGGYEGPVILIDSQDGVTVSGLTVKNGIDRNWPYYFSAHTGIHLLHANNCNISNNIVDGNGHGIWVYESSDNIIQANTVTRGNLGIKLDHYSHRNTIIGNIIQNNKLGIDGIVAIGLVIRRSNNNTVRENVIQDNTCGIELSGVSGTVFIRNTVQNNGEYNFKIFDYTSYEVATGYVTSVSSTENEINQNYWGDYTGKDNNQDGIGDTQYILEVRGQDSQPLMEPVVIPEFQSYIVLPLLLTAALFLLFAKKRFAANQQD
jgi:parallel beta-helix repeat protein